MNLVFYFSVFAFHVFSSRLSCFVFQWMFATQGYWENIPDHVKPNTKDLLTLLMKSKEDSTVKKYTKEIVKFSRWCNLSSIQLSPPFSVSLVISYLHKVYVISKSYATLSLTHAALKDVRANCFCASLLRTQMHTPRHTRARALSNKMRNDRAKGHCYSFAWI